MRRREKEGKDGKARAGRRAKKKEAEKRELTRG